MYCRICGRKLEDGAATCPDCGTEVITLQQPQEVAGQSLPPKDETQEHAVETPAPEQNRVHEEPAKQPVQPLSKIRPLLAVGLALSAITFAFGLVLISCTLANNFGMALLDALVILPAFAGFAIDLYYALCMRRDALNFMVAVAGLAMSAFTLFYSFIGVAVSIT